MRLRLQLLPLPILFALALSTTAFAQDDASTKAARARFKEGVEFYEKGQFENSRAAFLQAYALRKHPSILLNLGQSSLRSGHAAEAAKAFQQFLRESPSLTDAQRSDAEKGLAESRTKLGRITVNAPSATEISVDGAVVGVAPLSEPVDVEPGSHTVRAKYSDGTTDVKTLSLTAGEKQSVSLTPPEKHSPAPEKHSPTPPVEETPKQAVIPVAEKPAREEPSPPPSTEHEKPGLFGAPKAMAPFWIGASVAVVGGGVAIYMATQKSSAETNAKSVETQIRAAGGTKGICASTAPADVQRYGNACRTLKDNLDLVDTDATIGNVALGVGIAGAVFALGWYLFSDKKEAEPLAKLRVVPVYTGELRGASASFTF